MEQNSHKGIALVTGASSGIGKALAIELLAQGYEVIAISRSSEKLEKIKTELQNNRFFTYVCDVSDEKNVQQVSAQLQKEQKIPSFFYLNAGMAGIEGLELTNVLDIEKHQKIFSVNYYGVLNFVSGWLQICKDNGGATFVVTSSVNAIFAPPGGSAYSASKAAISKTFDGLRVTHFKDNLRFLSIFCGPVDTPGVVGKLPFSWTPEKMAKYMIRRTEKGKAHSNPSLFYSLVCKVLNALPEKRVIKILEFLSNGQTDNKGPGS